MEEKLDLISEGKLSKNEVLKEFRDRLQEDIKKSKEFKKEKCVTEFECPDCKKKKEKSFLVLRDGRFGKFFSCEKFSKSKTGCKYKADYGEDGKPQEKQEKQVNFSDKKCPKCNNPFVIRTGKYGQFLGCSKYPTCSSMAQLDGTPIEQKKKTFKKWKKK